MSQTCGTPRGRDPQRLIRVGWLPGAGLALLLGAGCSPELSVPDDLALLCSTDRECPAEWTCNALGTCEPSVGAVPNAAPVASLQSFASQLRFLREVPVAVRVVDPNADAAAPERVTIEVEYRQNGSEAWQLASVLADPSLDLELESLDGATTTIRWDALLDAQNRSPVLSTTEVDVLGDGALSEVVRFASDLVLRIRAVDAKGLPSPWIQTPRFSIGNELPTITFEPLRPEPYRNLVAFGFTVRDSSGDDATLSLQFRHGPEDNWRVPRLALGRLDDLYAPPEGAPHVVVWDAGAPTDVDPNVPQGLGPGAFTDVEFRYRLTDRPSGETLHHSLWDASFLVPAVVND